METTYTLDITDNEIIFSNEGWEAVEDGCE